MVTQGVKVAITGAAGLVGGAVLRLAMRRGLDSTAVVRPGRSPLRATRTAFADSTDEEALVRAFEGSEAVVHAAGRMEGTAAELDAANIEGTSKVVRACRRVGVARLVLVSTVAVYGTGDLLDVDESRAIDPRSTYAWTKSEAESRVREASEQGLGAWILRSTGVWSATSCVGFTALVFDLLRRGRLPLPRSGEVRMDIVADDDLASACLAAAARAPSQAAPILHIASDEASTLNGIVSRLAACGFDLRTVPVDDPADLPGDIPVWLLDAVREHRGFRIDRARAALDYEPVVRFPTGLRALFDALTDGRDQSRSESPIV